MSGTIRFLRMTVGEFVFVVVASFIIGLAGGAVLEKVKLLR